MNESFNNNNNNNTFILYSTFKRVHSQSALQHNQTQQSKLQHKDTEWQSVKSKSEIKHFKMRFKKYRVFSDQVILTHTNHWYFELDIILIYVLI